MAFPSNTGSKSDLPAQAWDTLRNTAGQVKVNSTNLRNDSAAGNVQADRVLRYVAMLADSLDSLARWTQVPGLLPYVREQLDAPTFDVVAEYNVMRTQMELTRNWVLENFPLDVNGYLLYHTFGGGGRLNVRLLSPPQLAGLRTQIDALLLTID